METTIDHVPQSRLLQTEIPGPRSRELMDRRRAAIPAGVGTTLGVFVARAAGGSSRTSTATGSSTWRQGSR